MTARCKPSPERDVQQEIRIASDKIMQLYRASNGQFWGSLTFTFAAGRIKAVKTEVVNLRDEFVNAK